MLRGSFAAVEIGPTHTIMPNKTQNLTTVGHLTNMRNVVRGKDNNYGLLCERGFAAEVPLELSLKSKVFSSWAETSTVNVDSIL